MFSSINTRLVWVSVSLSVLVTVAHADRLDMLGMGVLRGDLGSVATDINDLGVMTGYSSGFEFGNSHACVWSRTKGLRSIGALVGHRNSEGRGINNVGTVVGNSQLLPFIWTQTNGIRALPLPFDRNGGNANDVNNAGLSVGFATRFTNSDPIPVSWDDKQGVHELDLLPGGFQGEARRANDENAIVGWSDSMSGRRAVLWQSNSVTNLGVLAGFDSSEANGINILGTVVGSCRGRNGAQPFIWDSQTGMRRLRIPSFAVEGWATAISRNGVVIGTVRSDSGVNYAVYWKNGLPVVFNIVAPMMRASFNIYDATSINDRDQVSGSWVQAGRRTRGFLGKVIR